MKQIEFLAGTHLREAAKKLVAALAEHDEVSGQFNGINMTATKGATVDGILADYETRQEAAAEAYRKSPEGIKAAHEANARATAAKEKYAAQMRKLPTLDFGSEVAVLDWLCDIQDATDHVAVTVDRKTILAAFAAHGLLPGVNCGGDYRKGDRDNEYRWLVGQALETLRRVAIHSIIHKFAKQWKAQHAAETVA